MVQSGKFNKWLNFGGGDLDHHVDYPIRISAITQKAAAMNGLR